MVETLLRGIQDVVFANGVVDRYQEADWVALFWPSPLCAG
jgi:hypothetical protein